MWLRLLRIKLYIKEFPILNFYLNKYEQINVNRYECDVKIVQDLFFTIGVNFLQVMVLVFHVLVTNKIIKHQLKSDTPP